MHLISIIIDWILSMVCGKAFREYRHFFAPDHLTEADRRARRKWIRERERDTTNPTSPEPMRQESSRHDGW